MLALHMINETYFFIFNIHFQKKHKKEMNEMKNLAYKIHTQIHNNNIIIAGDFNQF